MTRPTAAILGSMPWPGALSEIETSFNLRKGGIAGPLPTKEPISYTCAFGSYLLAARLSENSVGVALNSGRRQALPPEYAGHVVIGNFVGFSDRMPLEDEIGGDVLLLSGKDIPPGLAVGIGQEALSGLSLVHARNVGDPEFTPRVEDYSALAVLLTSPASSALPPHVAA